jgi:hypothetical protein
VYTSAFTSRYFVSLSLSTRTQLSLFILHLHSFLNSVLLAKFMFQLKVFCVDNVDYHYQLQPFPSCAPPADQNLAGASTHYRGGSLMQKGGGVHARASAADPNFLTHSRRIRFDYLFGLYKKDASDSFFDFVFWDLICILALTLHRHMLARRGRWRPDPVVVRTIHADDAAAATTRGADEAGNAAVLLSSSSSSSAAASSDMFTPASPRASPRGGRRRIIGGALQKSQKSSSSQSLLASDADDIDSTASIAESQSFLSTAWDFVFRWFIPFEASLYYTRLAMKAADPLADAAGDDAVTKWLGADDFCDVKDGENVFNNLMDSAHSGFAGLVGGVQAGGYDDDGGDTEKNGNVKDDADDDDDDDDDGVSGRAAGSNEKPPYATRGGGGNERQSFAGSDYYTVTFTIELICVVYILLMFGNMATSTRGSVGSVFASNLFPGAMVVCLTIQILIMVADRVIYLYASQRSKCVLQHLSAIYWASNIFYNWPIASSSPLSATSSRAIFAVLKMAYFVVSAKQLQSGYPPPELTGVQFITHSATILRGTLFNIYKAIPFLYELRTILDWLCTATTLDLFETFKLEDIYATLFHVQCHLITRRLRARGEKQWFRTKLLQGFLLFCGLLLVLLLPLYLFSSANPATDLNNIFAGRLTLSLNVRHATSEASFPLAEINALHTLRTIRDDELNVLKLQGLIFDDSAASLQVIRFEQSSNAFFTVTPPMRVLLNDALTGDNVKVQLNVEYAFDRPGPLVKGSGQDYASASATEAVLLSDMQKRKLHGMFDDTLGVVHNNVTTLAHGGASAPLFRTESLQFKLLFPWILRLTADDVPMRLSGVDFSSLNLTVVSAPADAVGGDGAALLRGRNVPPATGGRRLWWEARSNFDAPVPLQRDDSAGVSFFTVSNPIFSAALSLGASYSIIGIYITVVLAVGRLIRFTFANLMQRIMFEDGHNVNDLMMFCEGIYMARKRNALLQEEELFRRLIFIYRQPKLLMELTRRKTKTD